MSLQDKIKWLSFLIFLNNFLCDDPNHASRWKVRFLTCRLSFPQTGLFKLSDEEFFIQPLEKSSEEATATQAHAIYRRHAPPPPRSPLIQTISGNRALNGTCGLKSKSLQIMTHNALNEPGEDDYDWLKNVLSLSWVAPQQMCRGQENKNIGI